MSAPRLHIIALGGTIASAPQTDAASGVAPSIGAEQIAAAAQLDTLSVTRRADTGAEGEPPSVTFEQLAQVGSGSITLHHLFEAVRSIRRAAADGADGVVLTQGTDTLEDSAFVLALLNDAGIPVALTGAMRNPSLPGADGGANVRAAARTALDPRMKELAADRRLAAVLVFADEVFDPLSVTKAHTTSVAAFQAGLGQGPLGWVSEDRLVLPHVPAASRAVSGWSVPEAPAQSPTQAPVGGSRSPEAPVSDQSSPEVPVGGQSSPEAASDFPRVAVIEVGLDDDLMLVEELAEAGYVGCVLAGVGGGHVPESTVGRVASLAAEIPVVLASRTGAGATLQKTYGYPGAEIDLLGRGLIPSGTLNARKARLALILAVHFATEFPTL